MAIDLFPAIESSAKQMHRSRPSQSKSSKTLESYSYLHELMKKYQIKDLVNVDATEFMQRIDEFESLVDIEPDGSFDPAKQHPITVQFHWGHRHNFGEYSKPGRMGNHHIAVIAAFIDELSAIERSLEGMKVLDIGCWTGGTSLLLAAMGADVVAIEEIQKYADCANYLKDAFDVKSLEVKCESLYECTADEFQDAFDLVFFPGVLHHLSDPKLALRIVFNCLKDGGKCLLETLSYEFDPHIAVKRTSDQLLVEADSDVPWGWNWLMFTPDTLTKTMRDVGFVVDDPIAIVDNRSYVVGKRERHVDMWRAGFSVRNIR